MHYKLILSGWLLVLLCSFQVHADITPNQKSYTVASQSDDVVARIMFDAIAHQFNLDIRFKTYTSFEAMLHSVQVGDSDFAANVTFTQQRAKVFDFSSPTNIDYTYLFSREFRPLETMKSIAVPEKSVYDERLKSTFPFIHIKYFHGIFEAQKLLNSGSVDGVIGPINSLKPMLKHGYSAQLVNKELHVQPVSIIATKGKHQEMLKVMEHFLYSSESQEILRHTVRNYQFELRRKALRQAVEESGLNLQQPLKVKFENLPQYATYHSNGNVEGISADVVMKACDVLLIRCEITSKPSESWASMFNDLRNNKIDILAPITVSQQRKSIVNFSDSYYHPKALLIKREGYKEGTYKDISELISERIGVIKEDYFEEMLHQMLPHKSLVRFTSQKKQIQALLDGDVDYIVLTEANFAEVLRESSKILPLEVDKLIGQFSQFDIAVGFTKNDRGAKLSKLFSQAIQIIDTSRIVAKYDFRPDWRSNLALQKHYQKNDQINLVMVVILLIVTGYLIQRQFIMDSLTKLRNRNSLCRRFAKGVSKDISIVYVEIDQFKKINETYGFEVGDKVLKELAKRMKKNWPGHCYRFSGDEFVAVDIISPDNVNSFIERIENFIYVDSELELSFPVTLSLGASFSRKKTMPLKEILGDIYADMAQGWSSNR